MPLGYDPFDFRRYLPPPASMYNIPVNADGSPGSFTSPVPTAPEVTPRVVKTERVDPTGAVIPPTPGNPPGNPSISRPEVTVPMAEGAGPDPRLVPTSRKVPEVATPIVGPTGDPRAPDERLVPTPASTAPPPNTFNQELLKLLDNKDFSGAMKALSGAFGKPPPAPPPFKVSGHSGGGGGVRDLSGSGQQLLASVMKGRKGGSLIGGDLGKRAKKARQDDPHEYEQEKFDWRRRQGRR